MATITEPTKIKLEFKEAVYMYGGDYNQGYNDGKDDGFNEGKQVGYDEGVEVGKANAPREERSVTYNANGTYEVLPSSSELLMDKVNVVVNIPDDGSYSEGYTVGYSDGEAYGKQNAPTEDLSITLTSNGTYIYSKPQDKYYDEVEVVVNVPSEKTPTQEKSVTITKNGTEVISPDSGYALSKVTVVTQIPERLPTQTKTIDIDENGTEEVTADSGYALEKVIINTDIDTRLPEQEKSLEVTENKTYEVTPDSGYALKKVTVTGNVASSGGGSGDDDGQLIKITTATSFAGINGSSFQDLIVGMDWTNFNKQKKTSLASLFYYYQGTNIDVANLDTSSATSMKSMFESCNGASFDGDLTHFDTKNVTNMNSMFANSKITQLNLSGWNVSKVTDMAYMFRYSPIQSLNLSGWNASSVKNITDMFYYCGSIRSLDLSSFDTSNLTGMDEAFYQCTALESLNLSSWDTSKISSNPYQMFYRCGKLTNVVWGSNWASHKGWNAVAVNECPLSKASILDLANKIADKSDTSVYTGTQTVKLKSSQKSLFTEEELTALANQFTSKNWTLAWS